eukprot:3406193-Pyramimonas_sp.AAC.1
MSAVLVTMVSGSRFQPLVWARMVNPKAAPLGRRPLALTAPTRSCRNLPFGAPMMAAPQVALAVGPARCILARSRPGRMRLVSFLP